MTIILKEGRAPDLKKQFCIYPDKDNHIPHVGDKIIWHKGNRKIKYKVIEVEWFLCDYNNEKDQPSHDQLSLNQIIVEKIT